MDCGPLPYAGYNWDPLTSDQHMYRDGITDVSSDQRKRIPVQVFCSQLPSQLHTKCFTLQKANMWEMINRIQVQTKQIPQATESI